MVSSGVLVNDDDVPLQKITDFKVVIISPDHNPKYHERKVWTEGLLKRVGFTDIEHYKSGTYAYPACLCDATVAILEKYIDEPVLIVEDDIEWTGVTDIRIHPDADAVYLGLSICAGSKTEYRCDGRSQFTPWSQSQVRVQNMLSAHAILYLTRKYKQALIDLLKAHAGTNHFNDVLMSRLQPNFTILANRKPSFYQASKFNGGDINPEYATKITL